MFDGPHAFRSAQVLRADATLVMHNTRECQRVHRWGMEDGGRAGMIVALAALPLDGIRA